MSHGRTEHRAGARWRDIAWSLLLPTVSAGCAAMVLFAFLPGVSEARQLRACLGGIAAGSLLALALGLTAALRRALQPAVRRAWRLLSLGFVTINLIPVGLAMSGHSRSMETGGASWADLFRLAFVPCTVAGLLAFPRRSGTRRVRYKIAFDMLTVMGGAFMLVWYFVIGHVLQQHNLSWLDLLVALAYPVGDLVMVFGVLAVLLHGVVETVRRPLALLAGGIGCLIANDIYLGYLKSVSDGVRVPADRWQYGSVAIGMFLLAMAGGEQCRQARGIERSTSGTPLLSRTSRLPYLALALGYGLMLVVAVQAAVFPWTGLVIGAATMTAGVAARQILAIRENERLLLTDTLTGLASRLKLHDSLDRAVERAQRTGRRIAVLVVDMDGFKQVNDSLGHEAGDRLLVGFANLLRSAVPASDTVARHGGDEFVIVLGDVVGARSAAAVADRITADMARPIDVGGRSIRARASIGIAVSDPAVRWTPAALLHQADLAMYRAKGRRADGAAYPWVDTMPHPAPERSTVVSGRSAP